MLAVNQLQWEASQVGPLDRRRLKSLLCLVCELFYVTLYNMSPEISELLMDGMDQLAGDHVYGHLPFLGSIAPVVSVVSVLLLVALLVLPDLNG